MNKRRRLLITSKDAAIISDRSTRYGRRLLKAVRRKLKKQPWQAVSIEEFCNYMGLDPESVYNLLGI
jgi:hypothetical protein